MAALHNNVQYTGAQNISILAIVLEDLPFFLYESLAGSKGMFKLQIYVHFNQSDAKLRYWIVAAIWYFFFVKIDRIF